MQNSSRDSNWFVSANACESAGGRLLWLYDKNITNFMTSNSVSQKCKNCSFVWIGLMQSVDKDGDFFWKRRKNGLFKSNIHVKRLRNIDFYFTT